MNGMDVENLGRCFESYGAGLALYGRQWLDPSDAEDVVQEAFIKLMKQNIVPDNVKAWLYCLVRNEAITRLRQRQRHQNRTSDVEFMQTSWFEREPSNPLDADSAQKALSALPDDLREVVVLRIWGEMTLKEMATVLALPLSSVFHKYQTAMEALRKKMEASCRTNTN
jgi:RNA polymerase sigma-70 factor (ECF subfamily)